MHIHTDDPKLTAYALGELGDSERKEIAAQVAQSEELRRAVEEIRATGDVLTRELGLEAAPALLDDQRQAIDIAAGRLNGQRASGTAKPWKLSRRFWIPTGLAASLAIVATLAYTQFPSDSLSRARFAKVDASHPVDSEQTAPSGPSQTAPRSNVLASRYTEPEKIDRVVAMVQNSPSVVSSGIGPKFSRKVRARKKARSQPLAYVAGARDDLYASTELRPSGLLTADEEKWLGSLAYVGGVPRPDFGREAPLVDLQRATFGERLTGESYDYVAENPFLLALQSPLSTFSIDVDTASYANVRRILKQGMLPQSGAVRIEEMVNYFDYDYPLPTGDDPFSVNVEVADCPWNVQHRLARIGIKGQEFTPEERPPANLVFLIDVSGSMQSANKLELLKKALKMLVEELYDDDSVAIAVYAGASGLVLPSTPCSSRDTIADALDRLHAGGSTNGGAGIRLAYDVAVDAFIEGGVNRVILATDGDFNVGTTSQGELIGLIEERAKSGVFLSVLGFGMGNYNDSTLEKLADKGNGNYAYIDTLHEARKVLVDQIGGTLITIAKDVKIQVEFNPEEVTAYRLIGYENRMLAAQDFNDDTKDAGEIGAGHMVTAFYEIVPRGVDIDIPSVDPLKYQVSPGDVVVDDDESAELDFAAGSGELMTVKLRYKEPDGDVSKLIEMPVIDHGLALAGASDDFVFASTVASFGMILRAGPSAPASPADDIERMRHVHITLDTVAEMASVTLGEDVHGYRAEFVTLVDRAIEIGVSMP